ncbi:MAG: hypothetical protein IKI08_05295, partial [Selenomonadaceae bacterium]|nr:hypothetical protein [Selenomonadaceae bacterium]
KYNTAEAYAANTSKSFTFEGVADGATASNFYLSGSNITIGLAAVKTDGTAVKLTDTSDGKEYNLKLGKGMTSSRTLTAAEYDSGVYQTKGITNVGYELSDDKQSIKYNTEKAYAANTSKSFTFEGVADGATASNFYLSGSNITIGLAAVKTDGTAVKLTDTSDGEDYNLKLGRGMTAATTTASLSGSKYTVNYSTAGYNLNNAAKEIKYVAKNETALELNGITKAPSGVSNGVASLQTATFNKATVTSNAADYFFAIESGTYTGKTFTGSANADTVTNAGASLTINLGNGNDSIISTGANVTINGGAGNDYIKSTGAGSSVLGGAGADTIACGGGADTIDAGAGNDIVYGGSGADSIFGNSGNDSLNGAAGNDSLWGGAGNDTLTGGAGADTFIYRPSEGTDTITDYNNSQGDILRILKADGTSGTYTGATFASNKLTLAIDGGSVILTNVKSGSSININGTTHKISGSGLS